MKIILCKNVIMFSYKEKYFLSIHKQIAQLKVKHV